jgi:hypothetical protein
MNLNAPIRPLINCSRGILLGVLLVSCTALHADTPQPAPSTFEEQGTISVVTELVVLPVRVTGPNGDFVSGLTQDQFRVYETLP